MGGEADLALRLETSPLVKSLERFLESKMARFQASSPPSVLTTPTSL
jgi:hypothetical protein